LDFGNSNVFTVWALKRPILHNPTKFREDLLIPSYDIAICVVFRDDDRRYLVFLKNSKFKRCRGPICVTLPNFIKIDQTVAEIWQFNSFHTGGRPPSWILEIQIFLTVSTVKRLILHNRAKFRKDRSNC